MELSNIKGNIVGIISDDFKEEDFGDVLVRDLKIKKEEAALKMVGLDATVLDKSFSSLSSRDKNKVILAQKLQDREIVLVNFTKGLTKKDIDFYKSLFKKIVGYGRRIFLVDKNAYLFLNCVHNLVVINKDNIVYETDDLFDSSLSKYIDVPKIVEFVNLTGEKGIRINHYSELDELLKAIYRIKS